MGRLSNDEKLQAAVEAGLAQDFLIDESQIEIDVAGGVVTLLGAVGSLAEKIIVQNTVRTVEGVHDVVDAVEVKSAAEVSPGDDELQEIIERVLDWDALVPAQDLYVSVADGIVALTGRCVTSAQAREAERAVSHIGGVRGLLNRIDIADAEPSTDQIRTAILQALTRRAGHRAAQIDVVVDGGTVALAGRVQSLGERRAILGAVGHTSGVEQVRDELVVERPPDS